ncbi:hypothetical protein KUV75_14815 [Qipengyuania gaetbuli]|uniref:hypothetical protein n=1 Tax=Qipengyuania gaetbuli TaxID=266952 RepID=UPI001C9A2302|nr:hypothetical protein [Qipengyuania gaetbuli]MBY6016166.1 hypothetical protein [Qipengyuania gaetbuli]
MARQILEATGRGMIFGLLAALQAITKIPVSSNELALKIDRVVEAYPTIVGQLFEWIAKVLGQDRHNSTL